MPWPVPTRRGLLLATGGVALVAAGRVLGLPELYILGSTAMAITALALVTVLMARPRLAATRTVEPTQVALGAASVAELVVRNQGRGRSPVVLLRDPVSGSGEEGRFLLSPLAPGQGEAVTYLLPTGRRGIVTVGPVRAEISDPFSLAWRAFGLGLPATLTVHPAVEPLSAPPASVVGSREASSRPVAGVTPAEEFFALRAYEEGDDLRRVHWPSTARLGRLVVRQDESDWGGRTSLLVDLRRGVHTDESVETALSAAASISVASRQSLLRVTGTDGGDSGFGRGPAHLRLVLRQLAGSKVSSAGDLVSSIARIRRRGDAGTLVAITTSASTERDLARITSLRARFRPLVLVVVSGPGLPEPSRRGRHPEGVTVVDAPSGRPFREAWDGVLSAPSRPRPWTAGLWTAGGAGP